MIDILLEQPITLGVCGGIFVLAAGFFWLQTGFRWLLLTTIGLVALTVILVLVSINVITDRERLNSLLYEVAEAVEANDHARVISYMHPDASAGVMRAKSELPQYDFSEARVTRVKEIKILDKAVPPEAIAEFNVVVEVGVQGQRFRVPRFVIVYFRMKDDRWLVTDYEHSEPLAAFKVNVGLNGR